MIVGVLLGPTVLGLAAPEFSAYVFSEEIKSTLYVISMIGLSLYMLLVGVEHESSGIVGRGKHLPTILGVLGVLLPLILGGGVAALVARDFKPDGVSSEVYLLFIGGALSITAFPMLARILHDRGMVSTRFGATAIKAAAIDDTLAWCVLAIIGAVWIYGTPTAALYRTILPAAIFIVVLFYILPFVFRKLMEDAVENQHIDDRLFAYLLLLVLAAGLISNYIGIYSVFGGFIAGKALPRVPGFAKLLKGRLLQIVVCLFLPVFFAYSGLNTNIFQSFNLSAVWMFLGLVLVAFVSKFLSAFLVLRVYLWSWGETIAMAGLMNDRGLMILIFVTIGLSLGIIETTVYSVMVLIAIFTTALAMPMYRMHFSERQEETARTEWRHSVRHSVRPA